MDAIGLDTKQSLLLSQIATSQQQPSGSQAPSATPATSVASDSVQIMRRPATRHIETKRKASTRSRPLTRHR